MKRLLLPVAAVGVAGVLAACGSSGGGQPSSTPPSSSTSSGAPTSASSGAPTSDQGGGTEPVKGSITVYAAASLTEAFNTIKGQFTKRYPGTSVTLRYDASSTLATQIQQGASVDVFASAAQSNMDQLGTTAVDPQTFTTNTAEIAVPPKNPGKITKLSDLSKNGVKVAVCASAVPCGVVAAQVFKNAGLSIDATANAANVKSTLALVTSKQVDAGIVYVTDVRAAGKSVKGIKIPSGDNASTSYPIARLKDAKNPAVAEAWIEYVRSADGQKVLKADGFAGT